MQAMRVHVVTVASLAWLTLATVSSAQGTKPFEPEVGQPGKDVVWVPTPPELVEKMLDLARVTPQDVLMDLGSGDGRLVIAAAKRGARAIGVEYSRNMVELSRANARAAGVGERAEFVQGDMYEADVSQATVLGLFLLPGNMFKLREKFLFMRPGSRIVANEYGVDGWAPDQRERLPNCVEWCNALLWIVPARVHGAWEAPEGPLVFDQVYQFTNGTLAGTPLTEGRLHADELWFTVGDARYYGRVSGNAIEGSVTRGDTRAPWRAVKR
jgi:SAM-dependent methyltransferase